MSWKAKGKKVVDETVTVNLPDGSKKKYQPLTADQVNDIAVDAGLVNFEVKDNKGKQLNSDDFPVNDGEITLSEYNEAKNAA